MNFLLGKSPVESEEYKKTCLYVFIIAALANLMLPFGRFCFSAMLKPMAADLGISRAATSSILSMGLIVYAFSNPAVGYLSDRFGFRRVVLVGGIIAFSGMILSSLAHSLWQLYLFYGILFGVGSSTFYSVPLSETRKWFGSRSGIVLALVSCAGAVGITVGPPLGEFIVRMSGWQAAYLVVGLMGMAILVPVTYFFKVPRIQDTNTRLETTQDEENLKDKSSISLAEAMRTIQFWLLSISYATFGVGQFIVFVHTLSYATDQGIGSAQAAFLVGLLGLIGIPARLVTGWWVDRQGRRVPLIILGIGGAASVCSLLPLHSIWQLWVFVFTFGLCYGGLLSQFGGLLGDIFGPRSLGSIYGLQTLFIGLAAAFGTWLGGFIFDGTGTYFWAYVVALISLFISAICLIGGSCGIAQTKKEETTFIRRIT